MEAISDAEALLLGADKRQLNVKTEHQFPLYPHDLSASQHFVLTRQKVGFLGSTFEVKFTGSDTDLHSAKISGKKDEVSIMRWEDGQVYESDFRLRKVQKNKFTWFNLEENGNGKCHKIIHMKMAVTTVGSFNQIEVALFRDNKLIALENQTPSETQNGKKKLDFEDIECVASARNQVFVHKNDNEGVPALYFTKTDEKTFEIRTVEEFPKVSLFGISLGLLLCDISKCKRVGN
jgi:hypothetical protein